MPGKRFEKRKVRFRVRALENILKIPHGLMGVNQKDELKFLQRRASLTATDVTA